MDEREGERRAERVDRGQQLEIGGQHERDGKQRAERDQHERGVEARVQAADGDGIWRLSASE